MDDEGPPPPPPPHGEKPNTTHGEYRKASDLPQGNYDIFIIPPHSAGSGFLYLPSLQCQRNSFIAGAACALVAVYVWMTLAPVVKLWYATTVASGGGAGIAILAVGVVGLGGWAFGNYQAGSGGIPRPGPGFGPNWSGSGGPGASGANGAGSGGANYSRGGNFGGQAGGSHQHGNYSGNYAGGPPPGNQYSGNQYRANNEPPPQTTPGPNPNTNPDPGPPPGPKPGGAGTKPADSGPQSESKPQTAEDWEKAREETRRKEDLRRKMEEFKRKREAEAREKERQRERERMEKELRERREQLEREMAAAREAAAREAKLQAEKEAAEHRARLEREAAEAKAKAEKIAADARKREVEARMRAAREAAEARAKQRKEEAEAKAKKEKEEAEAKAKREQEEAEAKARAEKEAAEKEAAAKAAAKKEADAKFAALKEAAAKKYAEKKARDAQEAAAREAAATASKVSSASAPPPRTPSPKKPTAPPSKASAPTADEDAYSFRPYDRPRRPYGASQGSVYSESSYAPSQSTARTTPPPSTRGAYETKDPDKIVIRGVYAFNQASLRAPVAQLVSGQNMVTDGLVLRITTEGLFIDDDVRGVPQREWDVKAWTMKLVEVWCPQVGPPKPKDKKANQSFFGRSTNDTPSSEESDAYLANFLKVCKNTCRLASPGFKGSNANSKESHPYGGLHVLRATIRDQEGRRYVFVLQETEGWKVALGLQRLRKGSQVRALGVCGMALGETRTILSGLGY
ncbi:uncharacterized protein DSM5745_00648 [Aspergillus mulundensis]|uniref:Trans-sialidase n=1 Tax=Aspergillus mulundensis TaxID=1810919 RepID=A0A3D8T443_9EURO|nr:Uncharacterized protein DSM5745_00648 [Aspergillus mulundensis]RDW93326.1 Uncharacterized protein DSM5745_00648 [Aspergillus mulundensis]